MGKEARVIAEIEDWSGEGKLLLETDELIFRGARRLVIPLSEITRLGDHDGWLTVEHAGGVARFDIGPGFDTKWAHAIRNPRTLVDKLDVKPGLAGIFSGDVDADFIAMVAARAPDFAHESKGRSAEHAGEAQSLDLIFLGASDPSLLERIPALRQRMKSSGAIWVIHPKGRSDLSHDAIMAIARPAGLVDVKSARFDESRGALKLMVPRSQR